jgi:hypothetical protein
MIFGRVLYNGKNVNFLSLTCSLSLSASQPASPSLRAYGRAPLLRRGLPQVRTGLGEPPCHGGRPCLAVVGPPVPRRQTLPPSSGRRRTALVVFPLLGTVLRVVGAPERLRRLPALFGFTAADLRRRPPLPGCGFLVGFSSLRSYAVIHNILLSYLALLAFCISSLRVYFHVEQQM